MLGVRRHAGRRHPRPAARAAGRAAGPRRRRRASPGMRLKLRPDSGAVSSLASAIASTGAGSATRASRSRSTPSRCTGRRAGAPSANGTTVAGVPRCRTWRSCASVSVSRATPSPRAVSHVAQFLHEALHAEAERLRVVDGRGEFEAAREAWRGHERRARIGHEAERAIERGDQRRAEAAREPVARQRRGFAERRDAGLAQCRARRVVHVDERERDRREDAGQLAHVGDRLRAAGAGAQQRGERRGRDADARRVTQRVRAFGQARGQARQAAEQAQAAADFGDQRVGRRDARHRRERQRPRGELRERAGFAVARRDRAAAVPAPARARPTRAVRRRMPASRATASAATTRG